MKRFLVAFILSMLAGLAVPAGTAAARPHTSTWHRLNPDQSNPAPEHERLRCREAVPLPFDGVAWPRSDCIFAPQR